MKKVNIYTDGACSGNQNDTNIGGWGCILEFNGATKELCGGEKNTTNNRMELTALIEALKALKEDGLELCIFSDSSYLINCFKNKWFENWQKNGWKTSAKKDVENKELWEKLLSLLPKHKTKFFLVKGHLKADADGSDMKAAYKKFCEKEADVSYDRFREIAAFNVRADALANVFIKENS